MITGIIVLLSFIAVCCVVAVVVTAGERWDREQERRWIEQELPWWRDLR